MATRTDRCEIGQWGDKRIPPGQGAEVTVSVGESYSGLELGIPIFVSRGREDGPVVFVTAAVHGDEINGTGAIRRLIREDAMRLDRGALVLVPVVNLLGFERHSRYLPDRRDLNRCFPGSSGGSLASRLAQVIFEEIISRCDYGIDLHTAAVRRTNYPSVRGDISQPEIAALVDAFGAEITIASRGPKGSLRRAACEALCPTIVFEAGEVWKVEPTIVESAVKGLRNVLVRLDMIDGEWQGPKSRVLVKTTRWVRAERGGFLRFHVSPGDVVDKGDLLATNTDLLGEEKSQLLAPFGGFVLGMTTLPSTRPGEPVFHLGRLSKAARRGLAAEERLRPEGLHDRLREDLAANVTVVDPLPDQEGQ